MEELLKQFINNESQAEAVREALHIEKRNLAADLAEKGNDTAGIQPAGIVIDKLFANLKNKYGIQAKRQETPKVNQGL